MEDVMRPTKEEVESALTRTAFFREAASSEDDKTMLVLAAEVIALRAELARHEALFPLGPSDNNFWLDKPGWVRITAPTETRMLYEGNVLTISIKRTPGTSR